MAIPTDRQLLYAVACVRAVATAMGGVLLGLYLVHLELDAAEIGVVVGAGLAGAAAAGVVATIAGDRIGRRRLLVVLGVLGAIGSVSLVFVASPLAAGFAAFIGMFNGMGRDRGASLILDQAILPTTTNDRDRTIVFARYNVAQDVGHALGSILAAAPLVLREILGVDDLASLRLGIASHACLVLSTAVLYWRLSPVADALRANTVVRMSARSRAVMAKISALFGLDSVAGGFLTTALLTVFFHQRFAANEVAIGALFFGARVLNAISHWAAARLAARFGLLNTMVFTHIPSSLLLVTVAFAPNFPIAAALFLLREGLVEMDVPTRQSYVMAVVRPEERTMASGVTNLVRLAGWAVAPWFAGGLMAGASLATPLFVGASLKVLYDVLLYAAFRGLPPPEEAHLRQAAIGSSGQR